MPFDTVVAHGPPPAARALAAKHGIAVFVPPIASCTDNAAMIAYAGALRLRNGESDDLSIAAYSRSHDLKRGKMRKVR